MNVEMDCDWGDEGNDLRITETQRLRRIAHAKAKEAERQEQIKQAAADADDDEGNDGTCHWCGTPLRAPVVYHRHHGEFCGPGCWDNFKEHSL